MLTIDYYSDILCVWAWIAQTRIDELNTHFGNQLRWRFHAIDVFGNVEHKMSTQWKNRGRYDGFSKHVSESVKAFPEINIHADSWTKVKPQSSANAHLTIKAVERTHDLDRANRFANHVRTAFFSDALDISDQTILLKIAEQDELDIAKLRQAINDGSAIALLMSDYQQAKQLAIKGSPSYSLDSGRQILYGNVGYRVLRANIEELLHNPTNEASWC